MNWLNAPILILMSLVSASRPGHCGAPGPGESHAMSRAGSVATPVTSIPSFPRYQGLCFKELEVSGGSRPVISNAVSDMSLSIWNQGSFEVARYRDPEHDGTALRDLAHLTNPACLIALHLNALSVPLRQPRAGQFVYKPMERALHQWIVAHDSWLRYSNGTIVQGSPGWGVFDIREPGFAEFYGSLAQQYRLEYGLTRIFLDETHGTLQFLAHVNEIVDPPSDAEQTAGIRALLEAAAGGARETLIWNGTLRLPDAADVFGGRMIQSAYAATAASTAALLMETVEAWDVGRRITMLEQPGLNRAQAGYLVCLAALYDGSAGPGNSTFTATITKPYPAGSFGRPVEYVNGTSTRPIVRIIGTDRTREFEHATVTVHGATKTATVTYHPSR